MNYMILLDRTKSIVIRPLVLKFVCAGFLLLIIWEVVYGFVFFRNLNQVIQPHVNNSQNKTAIVKQDLKSSRQNYRYFGDYVPKNIDAGGVRQSQLNLIVVGVISATDEKDSLVILQKPNGDELFFHVGDELPGGGVVKRITSKGVLVARDGELERLSLPQEELNFEAPAKPLEHSF